MSNEPNIIDVSKATFPDGSLLQADNYCRNPTTAGGLALQSYLTNVWCYVTVIYHGQQKYAIQQCKVPLCCESTFHLL